MTALLPEPAPARMRTGPSVWTTASRCSGFSEDRRSAAKFGTRIKGPECGGIFYFEAWRAAAQSISAPIADPNTRPNPATNPYSDPGTFDLCRGYSTVTLLARFLG